MLVTTCFHLACLGLDYVVVYIGSISFLWLNNILLYDILLCFHSSVDIWVDSNFEFL